MFPETFLSHCWNGPYLLHICRRMSEETGGLFGVSLSQHHLEELLMSHAPPPPLNEEATKVFFLNLYSNFSCFHSTTHPRNYSIQASLVHMGFPQKRVLEKGAFFSGRGGEYVCPRCSSRIEVLCNFAFFFLFFLRPKCLTPSIHGSPWCAGITFAM